MYDIICSTVDYYYRTSRFIWTTSSSRAVYFGMRTYIISVCAQIRRRLLLRRANGSLGTNFSIRAPFCFNVFKSDLGISQSRTSGSYYSISVSTSARAPIADKRITHTHTHTIFGFDDDCPFATVPFTHL